MPSDDTPIRSLPNIGPIVAATLEGLGLRTRADLERQGSVGVFRAVCRQLGRAPPKRFYLYGIEAALLGLPVSSLPPRRRVALAREALELPPSAPARDIRPRRIIRSRGRHRSSPRSR